ncbi:ROK family protein [soil metagenome]
MAGNGSDELTFGVDVGGSGVKGGLVDLTDGALVGQRQRIATPQPATPQAVAAVVGQVVGHFDWTGAIGVTLPVVITGGIARTAANVDPSWIGTDVRAAMAGQVPGSVSVLNDADAAGLAEVRFGAGKEAGGVVLLLTFGTGIGSALFVDGRLVPNTEFGHIEVDGRDGEHLAAAVVREREGLGWAEWVLRVDRYLDRLERLIWPDLIIVGGGVSKKADKWVPRLATRTPVRPAELQNEAGIVGAALAATMRT